MIETIGIIGGTGQMGRMFAREFRSLNKRVMTTDITSVDQEKALVENCELIIISVPIEESEGVVRRIQPWLRDHHLLSDFCSVKNRIIPAMLETNATLISCHPMFGFLPEVSKQNLILIPIRDRGRLEEYRRLYDDAGLNVVIIQDWEKHDQYMSIIQGLMHFFHIVFTHTLKNKDVDLSTLLSICSPVYRANFAFTCRILQRDPGLYTHILMDNPENVTVLSDFIHQARKSLDQIEGKDIDGFAGEFKESRSYLGEFAELFSSQSDYLVEKIKEYQS